MVVAIKEIISAASIFMYLAIIPLPLLKPNIILYIF